MYTLRLKGTETVENIFFIIRFYEIMHKTIVQNKIITITCSCLFFVQLIFIGLSREVQLGMPN